jgi:hypothetical protein
MDVARVRWVMAESIEQFEAVIFTSWDGARSGRCDGRGKGEMEGPRNAEATESVRKSEIK